MKVKTNITVELATKKSELKVRKTLYLDSI